MNGEKMNATLHSRGILIPVDELMDLLEQHKNDQIDEVSFQKGAAELIVNWAAEETSLKGSISRRRVFDEETGTYMGDEVEAVRQILVDIVPKPQAEWNSTEGV
jgi:hypothetical protein